MQLTSRARFVAVTPLILSIKSLDTNKFVPALRVASAHTLVTRMYLENFIQRERIISHYY